jgi:beta-lactamase class A
MRKLLLVLLTLLISAGVLLAPSYLRYRQTRGAVPPGVRVGGLDFGSANGESVAEALTRQFAEPVAVYYADQRILLRPQMLGFQVDVPAMLAEAQAHETAGHLLRLWVGEALHQPPPPVEVPLRYKLDRDQLDVWLTDLAARYDRAPSPARALSAASGIAPGKPGWQLDIPASRLRVVTALSDLHIRTANLAVRETMPPPMDMKLLAELLRERSEQFPGVVGIFLHHIPTGEELALNGDVAYSGMGAMKLVILEELFRKLNASPDPQTGALISETVSMAGTRSANALLALIGDGDAAAGVNALNASMRKLGLKSTFMAAPFDQAGSRVTTPANSRTDISTEPDPNIQTTPREIGMVMQMLVECEQGGGTLLAAYAMQITQAECQKILDTLKLNEITALILSGLPQGTQAVHRHGYTSDTEGDVAVIWGPTGPYVLSIFLYRPSWLEWDFASETMGDLSRIVWNYFTLANQQ